LNIFSQHWKKIAHSCVAALSWFAFAAHAVNDLPGGPSVRQLGLHNPATKLAQEQADLHWFMMMICLGIFVVVFGVMFYSIWKHRKSVGHVPATFHESVKVEIAWTVVPFIIVIFMAIPATRTVIAQKDTANADLTIKATGYQWRWGYEYLKGEGQGISYISSLDNEHRLLSNNGAKGATPDDYLLKVDNPLVVPVGKKIRIITTSSDVIHAFAVPSFGIKQDAIPGFVRDTHFRAERVGDFYGQCQELCGKEHAYMPIHVKVLSEADYAAWVQKKKSGAPAAEDKKTAAAGTEQVAQAAVTVQK